MENGISEKCFIPITSIRSKEAYAYAFNISSTCEVIDALDEKDNCNTCDECGRQDVRWKEESYEYNELCIEDAGKIDFSKSDVIASRQYYYGERMVLVSPRLYQLIKEKCKKAEFMPVFVKEHSK